MTDTSEVANKVASDVVEEVDVGSALTGGDVTEGLDGESLGRSVGETIGETVGRLAGRALVDWLVSKLTFWSDDDDPSFSARFGRSLAVAVGRTLQKPEFKEPIGDAIRGAVSSLEERQQAAKDAAEETTESVEDAAEETAEGAEDAADEATESAEDAAEEAAGAATEGANAVAEKLGSGDMDELRKETYRELLEMMEYSKLQSIAKESGVKANLQRDEMIDAIVENFDPDEGEESDDSEESAESDESDEDESE